jgi:hypothetical protein
MNCHYPISIVHENALNFTFETQIRVTRFTLVKTLYPFNCKYCSGMKIKNINNSV